MAIEMSRNPNTGFIDLNSLRKSSEERERQLKDGLIAPAEVKFEYELAVEHAAEPLKRVEDIIAMANWFLERKKWRDYMFFIVGINFGLRVGDLVELRFANIINDNFQFRESFAVFEKKTRNTRKKKRNRHITVNDAVIKAVTLFLEHTPGVTLDQYMFQSESGNSKNSGNHLTTRSADRILKAAAKDLGFRMNVSTHTLRKTFAYHQMLISGNDPRKLLLLQKMLGHSTAAQTLEYIGITEEEMAAAYKELNLGLLNEAPISKTVISYDDVDEEAV